ncbi:phosphatidylethanolamine N-methyltransferase [Coniosporium apollinis CBS 100218]|uniref:Phosphatidylethanolamine N-methyltransferase n=1 Tax=Coniosporium apollinis (strain CBS 100218) TaxID=1168221 RepID=R7YG09_CONA1|nr:phosphatidylethanolamine N-methyltransferase [Coniosporium apollinis CBS 100218]EON60830.1 phosphatidylethanolamine N-methyltransferase [Coniosporium apollinis CBS 100218]
MSVSSTDAADQSDGLRERLTREPEISRQAVSAEAASKKVMELNSAEEEADKGGREKRTYGRTPDGTVFTVPQTHDMVSQLLSPSQPKNLSDILVLAVLAVHVSALYWLPEPLRIPVFAVVFLFWRACYNAGIGYLLYVQSNHNRLVSWASKSKIFENPSLGQNPHPNLYAILKREMETKIPKDYKFEEAPLEYNTWLLFRRVVDLILMCDFVSYCLFAVACGGRPVGESYVTTIARWAAGIALVLFNLWVKLDAHRVVKDFAWYWGDFFYLIDQNLTFDGVFEMAPHPMYSVGYAGYYGISLMAASYKVLFISIVAHAAQFAFLSLVESPHIEKTYNPPPPRKLTDTGKDDPRPASREFHAERDNDSAVVSTPEPSPVHNIIGFQNIDFHRVTDTSVLLFQLYLFLFAAVTPPTPLYKALFVTNAIVWRLWYSLGVGYILDRQAKKKNWTRHFIKYGESTEEAWRQWKGLYHLSMTMTYASFICAAWKMYALPPDWSYGMATLRHVFGAALIALQLWTVVSIYESLGEFGWFFGDFFFDQAPKLTYSGIYRFLNNPERFLGLAGVWGFAIITWSKAIFFLAFLSHILTLAFIQFVERPHMQKLYGESIRQHSGLSKSLQRSLPSPIRQWQGSMDRVLGDTVDFLEDLIESAQPKLAAGVGTFVRDSTALFKSFPARVSITRLAPDLAGYDPKDYSISVSGTPSSALAEQDKRSGREGEDARLPAERRSAFKTLSFEYGAPIKVRWTAPLNHSKKDWIGLYMVADNASRDVTRVSSQGRWIPTTPNQYDSVRADAGILVSDTRVSAQQRSDGEVQDFLEGEMEFGGDKLWWTTGVFEFRYHHDGKHNVMAISLPFEIRIGRFDEDDVEVDANGLIRGAVEQALLPVVRNCFDRDPEIAPGTTEELFGSLVERDGKYAKRVVFAVHQMFGIEFAPEVVQADGSVKKLAWRICNAKKVLAPYSMSPSRGHTTPDAAKY